MQITQLNVITEIPFAFSQKYQTGPLPNRRSTVYFGTHLISVICIGLLLKQISMWALPTVPLFAGKSRFFHAKCPSKNILQVGRSEYMLLFTFISTQQLIILVLPPGVVCSSNRALPMPGTANGDAISHCQVMGRAGSVHHGAD